MTEKINSLLKHFAQHKKDKASFRGYQVSILCSLLSGFGVIIRILIDK
jgi:hypothetical protein